MVIAGSWAAATDTILVPFFSVGHSLQSKNGSNSYTAAQSLLEVAEGGNSPAALFPGLFRPTRLIRLVASSSLDSVSGNFFVPLPL